MNGELTVGKLVAKGMVEKVLDDDEDLVLSHGLGRVPEYAIITPVNGAEYGWRVVGMNEKTLTVHASARKGTQGSRAFVVAGSVHSLVG